MFAFHQDHQRPPHCCGFWSSQHSDPPGPLRSLWHNIPHHSPYSPIWLPCSYRYSTLLVPVLFNKQETVYHHWRLQFHPSSSQPGCVSRLWAWTPPLHHLHAPPWSDNLQTWSQLPFLCWWYSIISLHQTIHQATTTVTRQMPAWYKTLDDIKHNQTKHQLKRAHGCGIKGVAPEGWRSSLWRGWLHYLPIHRSPQPGCHPWFHTIFSITYKIHH